MQSHQLINQTSGKTEWYSPIELVEAARQVMGGIDLDPASSERANAQIVKADHIFKRASYILSPSPGGLLNIRSYDDWGGLSHMWYGRIWMNHPFGSREQGCKPECQKQICKKRGWHTQHSLPGNADWISNIVDEYKQGNIEQACVLTYAATSEKWFQPLKQFPICWIDGRVNYLDPETLEPVKGVTKGSCVTYLGENVWGFVREFNPFGRVMEPVSIEPVACSGKQGCGKCQVRFCRRYGVGITRRWRSRERRK